MISIGVAEMVAEEASPEVVVVSLEAARDESIPLVPTVVSIATEIVVSVPIAEEIVEDASASPEVGVVSDKID